MKNKYQSILFHTALLIASYNQPRSEARYDYMHLYKNKMHPYRTYDVLRHRNTWTYGVLENGCHGCTLRVDLDQLDRVKRIWYLSPMRAAKVQASLRIRAVSPEPSLLARTGSESRGTFRQKARSLAPLNGWVCAVKICHDGMLEDTNSLDGAQLMNSPYNLGIHCLHLIQIFP